MASLNTFGAILSHAIELESQLSDFYSGIGDIAKAKTADKRRKKLERVRQENVVEITLEPIEGLEAADYALDLRDASESGQAAAAKVAARFYAGSMCAPRSERWSAVARRMAVSKFAGDRSLSPTEGESHANNREHRLATAQRARASLHGRQLWRRGESDTEKIAGLYEITMSEVYVVLSRAQRRGRRGYTGR